MIFKDIFQYLYQVLVLDFRQVFSVININSGGIDLTIKNNRNGSTSVTRIKY